MYCDSPSPRTIHIHTTFSSYKSSKEGHETLSYSLDYHIPPEVTKNSVNTEFEMLFQNLFSVISAIPEQNQNKIVINL